MSNVAIYVMFPHTDSNGYDISKIYLLGFLPDQQCQTANYGLASLYSKGLVRLSSRNLSKQILQCSKADRRGKRSCLRADRSRHSAQCRKTMIDDRRK